MKKSFFAVAALSMFASAAQAESSVTLFGLLDTGFNYVSNVKSPEGDGKSKMSFAGASMQGSHWGLRGTQDLGSGLKAVFALESGFDVNNGEQLQNKKIFGRQAFVGIGSDFGTITIGRQYDSIADFVSPLTAAGFASPSTTDGRWAGSYAAHPGDIDNFNNSRRLDKSIKYTSNNYQGLSFGGAYVLDGVPGHVSGNQIWSAGVGYANGPVTLGAAYLNAKTPASSYFWDEDQAGKLATNPIYGDYANAKTLQIIGAGGMFDFGGLTAGVNYSRTELKNSVIAINGGTITATPIFQNAEANLAYRFTPGLVGLVAYDYTWTNKINENKARYHQVTVSLTQALSKSVSVYGLAAYQKANGNYASGKPVVAAINGADPSTKNSQTLVNAGLRVMF